MINIRYEIYHNDYNFRYEDKSFKSLSDFKDWMFGLMNRPYVDSDGHKNMYFLDYMFNSNRQIDIGSRIEVRPVYGGACYWIHCVSDNNNIVFSNGQFTNGQCYISEGFKAFLKECQDKRDGKVNDFVFGEVSEPAKPSKIPAERLEVLLYNAIVCLEEYGCDGAQLAADIGISEEEYKSILGSDEKPSLDAQVQRADSQKEQPAGKESVANKEDLTL